MFGSKVAGALGRLGVAVQHTGGPVPFEIPEGTTLTSEQVRAAVGADPGRLAARFRENVYRWNGAWERWSARASEPVKFARWTPNPMLAPNRGEAPWELVYRPDLEHAPEEPPRPAQGTTLRAIMEWCGQNRKCVTCERSVFDHAVSVDGEGDLETSFWLSVEDIYESSDWRASTDDGKTWFVPGQVDPSEYSGPKETVSLDFMREAALPLSEAVRHAEAGGVTGCEGEFFRVRDGVWECRSSFGDSWDADEGKWLLTTGCEYTLYPADHLDDAPKVEPREGPELWAWMVRTLRPVDVGDGTCRRVRFDGRIESRELPSAPWDPCGSLPDVPCVPVNGQGWNDEADHG